jgi:hypothetical protein
MAGVFLSGRAGYAAIERAVKEGEALVSLKSREPDPTLTFRGYETRKQ